MITWFTVGVIVGLTTGYAIGKRHWIEAADQWRSLWEESMTQLRTLLFYQASMITTLDRAQAIAESFGAEDAFAFIMAELDDWPTPDIDA